LLGAMATDLNIISDFDNYYNEAYTAWDAFYPLAERDLRFFLGDQWDEKEKRQLYQEGRSTFVFNRVRRNINMVTGYQRKNRLSSVVAPVEDSDQKTADQLSQLLLYSMNYGNGYQVISDSFGGALKTGWNLASVWVDYRDDPVNGDIKFAREPYNGFIVDPYFTNLDFSDAGYILRRKYLNVGHCASLLPGQEKEVYRLYELGWERDDKFTWLPYQRQPNGQKMMAYNEMYVQKWRNVPMLVDMETGETLEFDVDKKVIKEFIEVYPQLKVVNKPKRYIEMNVIVNDQLMKTEENPYDLDEYPFVPFTAIFEPESDQWGLKVQSLTRCMVDPQREANRRRSQMTDILDSQINSGWIANENSVINPNSLFQSSQGKVIWRREDAAPGALEKIQPAQIPPSMFQLQELYDRDMMEIAGINDAAFGQTENAGESGVMMMLRQGAAIVNLQELFDNLRASQKALSKKVVKLIQKWRPQKVQRILNEEPSEQFYNSEFTKYDITVQEGILTDTQRQMYFRQLVDLKQLGAPVTGEMLAKAAPIQGKSEYTEQLSQMEQQQAQQAQEQQKLQQELLESQRQLAQAKAISDIALSKERFTRAVANNSLSDERAAAAVEDRTDAALNRVKAVKELQEIDDNRLVKYLGIIKMMEEMSRQEEIDIKKDDVAIASKGQEIGDEISGIPQMSAQPQQMQPQQENPQQMEL
jgi:hypothetical protein